MQITANDNAEFRAYAEEICSFMGDTLRVHFIMAKDPGKSKTREQQDEAAIQRAKDLFVPAFEARIKSILQQEDSNPLAHRQSNLWAAIAAVEAASKASFETVARSHVADLYKNAARKLSPTEEADLHKHFADRLQELRVVIAYRMGCAVGARTQRLTRKFDVPDAV